MQSHHGGAYLVLAAVVTALTWTMLRPFLVLTDGVPTATDPFSPFAVALVNGLLVAAAWGLLALYLRGASRPSRR